jgi:hypothetical protein
MADKPKASDKPPAPAYPREMVLRDLRRASIFALVGDSLPWFEKAGALAVLATPRRELSARASNRNLLLHAI